MDISHRGADYEVPKATVDGESHGVIVLVAIGAGAILASIILIILVTVIERSKKKQPKIIPRSISPIKFDEPSTSSSTDQGFNQSISTISDRVSMASDKSYCSGVVVIEGQKCCCQKIPKALSQISVSSGISTSSEITNNFPRTKEEMELHEIVTRF
ncbi:uncharacterized protein LOC134831311 [Culicoides brevitarsis]|uniref:uncharacterized protein LOC134831311 n=1 Tax=Culicoides brevitarsis TaxID=469753 RepID=UPI00307C56F0